MSESNNLNTLLRELDELLSLYRLNLEQRDIALRMNTIMFLDAEKEYAFFLRNLQEKLKRENAFVQSHLLNQFEAHFGFPVDFFPFFFNGTFGFRTVTTTRSDRPTSVERLRFFELKFTYLSNDDNRLNSFRSTFRMDQGTFEWLVNRLQDHPELQFSADNATPVYIQVAICLLRLANNHVGYRMAYLDWFVSNGSYVNFTRRVVKAIKGLLADTTIQWPTTYDRASEIATGFEYPLTNSGRRLDNIVGAIDGKNCIIRMPSPPSYGAFFRDRHNRYSVKLTAVCDSDCRFLYVRIGDSG
jgi:hypothetical protein